VADNYELNADQRVMLRAVALALGDVQEEAAEDIDPDVLEILALCRSCLLGLTIRPRQEPHRGEVIRMRLAEVNGG
jgi:hypothetical protein